MKLALSLTVAVFAASPLAAQAPASDPLAPLPGPAPVVAPPPAPMPAPVVVPKDWRGVFDAIDVGNWASAQAGIAVLPQGLLTPVAKAELYTAKGSPPVDLVALATLVAQAPELPQAAQLARMAQGRGALEPLSYYPERRTVTLGSAPVRSRARPVSGEPAADELRAALDPLIKVDDAAGAEAQLLLYAPQISTEARAEAGQRVAFAYYTLGLDMDARRVAETWRQGATGEWNTHSAWVAGLASWRLGDCEAASRAFQTVAATSQQRELAAGGYYWAARAEQIVPPSAQRRAAAEGRGRLARKFLRPPCPRVAGHGHPTARRSPHRL